MFRKLFNWATGRLMARAFLTPYSHLDGYMERYWLVPYKIGSEGGGAGARGCGPVAFRKRPIAWCFQKLGVAIRVHKILRSDIDRAFHDHPWPFVTIICRNGYTEVTPVFDKSGLYKGERREFYQSGKILFRRAKDWHRLEIIPGYEPWTIFITGPWQQRWGFKPTPKNDKIYYKDYLYGDKE